jgi:predicted Zn-dependent protease
MAEFYSESDARELCDLILGQSSADGATVTLSSGQEGHTRFVGNEVTTSAETSVAAATITSLLDGGSASVSWNDLSPAAIQSAVARSEELARITPRDPEQMPLLGAQQYLENESFFSATAELDAAGRAAAVAIVTAQAAAAGLMATGLLHRYAGSVAVANSNGLFAYHDSTEASFATTVHAPDGSGTGWAGTAHNDWLSMTAADQLAAAAIEKAQMSQSAEPVPAGRYTVLLEPTAVGQLVQLAHSAFDARAADEGRSRFTKDGGGNRLGEQVADERITLISDPSDPELLARPFTADGLPLARTVWIEEGILRNLAYSRYWAQQHQAAATPLGGGIKLIGGDGTTADMVGTVDLGLLVTRFWNVRPVDPHGSSFTGLTRDGTFLIEGGQIVRPVSNLGFKVEPIAMLNAIEGIGEAIRVVASESGEIGAPVVVPPLLVRDFHFTSVSDTR